jgi:NADPH-dependent ferric siderophore reductase
MTDIASRKRTVRFDLQPRLVTVATVEEITPTYRRITFTGDDLATFQSLSPEDHIKVAVPEPGRTDIDLPEWGPNGLFYPEGRTRPQLRDYTPRSYSQQDRTLVVDLVLHGDGPASNWAARAEPGHRVGIMGPRGSHLVEDVFDWYLMIGDETVLPSIARRLAEAKPETTYVAFIEVNGPEDEQAFDTVANTEITWVHRNGDVPGTTTGLEEALRAFVAGGLPSGEVFVWAGGEAGILKGIRRFLLNEAGFDRNWTSFSGHWKYGVADHDHHEPIED